MAERFWERVDKTDGCWLWTGSKSTTGYAYGFIGSGGRGGKVLQTHRVSWELHYGPIPEGMCVCHTCDNPPCVNPAHLFLGTARQNLEDAQAKGRLDRGANLLGPGNTYTT